MKRVLSFLFALLLFLPLSSQSQTIPFSIQHDGNSRGGILYLPSSYTASQSYPLVFNLHGHGSNANEQMLYSGMNAVAEAHQFIVFYPEGLNNSWNNGNIPPYNSSPNDVGFISALIDSLRLHYSIDSNRVFSCGLSSGGFMSYRLACDLSQRITAVASVAGTMSELTRDNCSATRTVPVMQVHGSSDNVVPPGGILNLMSVQDVLDFWIQHNDCPVQASHELIPESGVNDNSHAIKKTYAICDAGTDIWYFEVVGGGHTWPGAMQIPGLGNTCMDFNASQEIWHFFSRFSMQGGSVDMQEWSGSGDWNIYPNPNTGTFVVKGLKENTMVELRLLDMQGRVLKQENKPGSSELKWEFTGKAGLYILQVKQGGEISSKSLFIAGE